jgi:hypothetical protein
VTDPVAGDTIQIEGRPVPYRVLAVSVVDGGGLRLRIQRADLVGEPADEELYRDRAGVLRTEDLEVVTVGQVVAVNPATAAASSIPCAECEQTPAPDDQLSLF